MHNIGLIVNETKDKNLEITRSIIKWIEDRGKNLLLSESISARLNKRQYFNTKEDIYKKSDFIVVLGGDGTILGVARETAGYETPILGVNLGHLGFLAEVEISELFESLDVVLNNGVKKEERLMLQSSIYGEETIKEFYALNDIVITRGLLSRIVTLKVLINDVYVTTLKGDGLIISTPTGSTAYSLSAGGPIISPDLSVIVLTPICPHSLANRSSIVISENETVNIDLSENYGDAYLTIDGQEGYKIGSGENVFIKKAPFKTKLVKILNRSFFDVLRKKLTER